MKSILHQANSDKPGRLRMQANPRVDGIDTQPMQAKGCLESTSLKAAYAGSGKTGLERYLSAVLPLTGNMNSSI
jgi:hypothetical protein